MFLVSIRCFGDPKKKANRIIKISRISSKTRLIAINCLLRYLANVGHCESMNQKISLAKRIFFKISLDDLISYAKLLVDL